MLLNNVAIFNRNKKRLQMDTPPSLNIDTIIDTIGASTLLNIPAATLIKWRSTGQNKIPYIKIGRQVKYRTSALLAYIEQHTVK